jgi:hypothetical protein
MYKQQTVGNQGNPWITGTRERGRQYETEITNPVNSPKHTHTHNTSKRVPEAAITSLPTRPCSRTQIRIQQSQLNQQISSQHISLEHRDNHPKVNRKSKRKPRQGPM